MSLRCFLGHRYEPVAARPYIDISWGGHALMTATTVRCTRCGSMKYDQLVNGHVEIGDLRKRCGLEPQPGRQQ